MFYGWRVVGGLFVVQLFVVGFFTYAASLLVAPVREEFGVSLEQVMYGFTIGTLIGLVLMPVAGIMLDRYPVRWLTVAGALVFVLGLWGLSHSAGNTRFVILFGLTMALSNAFAGSMAASTVISRWFTASRGRALGIAAIGTSVGGILVPKLLAMGIAELGWRDALSWLAVATLLLMVPLAVLLVRGKPSDVGMEPEPEVSGEAAADASQNLSSGQILALPGFWFLSLSLGLLFSSYSSMLANLGPYALSLGQDEGAASTLIMTVAVTGLLGKLAFGALADKVNLKLGLATSQMLVLAGFMLLSIDPSYTLMLVATACIGLAAGGMLPVWGAITARVFGLLSYGRAMGMMGPVITLCILPGYTLVGRLFDTTGSYTPALQVFSAVLVVSLLLLLPLRIDRE